MSKDMSQVFRWSVIILVVIATAAFTMSACGGGDEPESTPTVTIPTATAEPFGQRFVREQVAKTISRVALEYGCRVDPSDIDVSEIVEPSLWEVFLTWAGTWLLTDADMRGALKSTILDWDISPQEFVDRLPGCDPGLASVDRR